MKRIISHIILLASMLMAGSAFAQVDRSHAPKADQPKDINLGDLQTITLDNGLDVFLVPKPGYGKFVFSMTINHPSFEEETHPELRSALSDMYYNSGSEHYTKSKRDSIINYFGAKSGVTLNGGFVIGLNENREELMDLYVDELLMPTADEAYIAGYIKKTEEKQAKKREGTTTARVEEKSVYSEVQGALLGSPTVEKTKKALPLVDYDLSKVTVSALNTFHDNRIVAARSTAILMGDFTEKEAVKFLNHYFGDWNAGEELAAEPLKAADAKYLESRQIYVVNKPSAVQSKIGLHWNLQGVRSYDENEMPLLVMNQILGGYTKSYLNQNLREEKGLCYFAMSNISTNAFGGTGFVRTTVRTEKTEIALESIILEMLRLKNRPVLDEDLRTAKNSLIGDYARSLSGTALQRYLSFSMVKNDFNLPDDYLKTYTTRIGQVTVEEVQAIANQCVKPNNCLVFIEGDVENIKKQGLESFGPVTYLDEDGEPYVFGK